MADLQGGILNIRPEVEFWYLVGDTPQGTPVTARAVNAENGDIGVTHELSDGTVGFSYPPGTDLVDTITVTRDDTGAVIAEFEVAVKIAA